jgi:hypothetical protein
MEHRVSIVTLGLADLKRSPEFDKRLDSRAVSRGAHLRTSLAIYCTVTVTVDWVRPY